MAIFPIVCTKSPDVDLTSSLFEYLFLIQPVENASIGCLTFETAVENSSLPAFSL